MIFNWTPESHTHKAAVWALFCSFYVSRFYHVIANHLPYVHGYADDTYVALSLVQAR